MSLKINFPFFLFFWQNTFSCLIKQEVFLLCELKVEIILLLLDFWLVIIAKFHTFFSWENDRDLRSFQGCLHRGVGAMLFSCWFYFIFILRLAAQLSFLQIKILSNIYSGTLQNNIWLVVYIFGMFFRFVV